jgi:hypothetical protein
MINEATDLDMFRVAKWISESIWDAPISVVQDYENASVKVVADKFDADLLTRCVSVIHLLPGFFNWCVTAHTEKSACIVIQRTSWSNEN